MPGRSFSTPSYRYGFNGQEKEDEVSGSANSLTAEFWQYDTRLARRWNLDPKPQVPVSSYMCLGNSPLWYMDPLGDIFFVTGSQQSKDDVTSIVDNKYKNAVKIDEKNQVTIDFDQMKNEDQFKNKDGVFDQEKFDKFVETGYKDKNIKLINDLATAKNSDGEDEWYAYGADYSIVGRSRTTGDLVRRTHQSGESFDMITNWPQTNLSTTIHSKRTDRNGDRPNGIDGHVNLPPGTAYSIDLATGSKIVVPRNGVVEHELREIYLRTHYGMLYDKAHPKAGGTGELIDFIVK